MNNKRREQLRGGGELLDRAHCVVSDVLDAEQDCLDNMPENLQYSDRYEKMELAIEKLEETLEYIESARDSISEAIA